MENFESALVPEFTDNTDSELEESTETLEDTEVEDAGQGENEDTPPVEDEPVGDDVEEEPAEETVMKSQYDNLRKDYTKKSMELAALKKKGNTEAPNDIVATKQPTTVQEFIQQEVEKSLNASMAPIKEQQEDLRIQAKVKSLSDEYEDFDDVADSFIDVLDKNPELFEVPNGLDIAFQAARGAYLERSAEAKAIAVQQAKEETKRNKTRLADTNATKKESGTKLSDADEIKNSIFGDTSSSSTFNF